MSLYLFRTLALGYPLEQPYSQRCKNTTADTVMKQYIYIYILSDSLHSATINKAYKKVQRRESEGDRKNSIVSRGCRRECRGGWGLEIGLFFIVRELNPLRSSRERWFLAGSVRAPAVPDVKCMT